METQEKNDQKLLNLYSHISRMYNSSASICGALALGWLVFLYSRWSTADTPWTFRLLLSILLIGAFFYTWVRTITFGMQMNKMEDELGLRQFIGHKLPWVPLHKFFATRRKRLWNFTIMEVIFTLFMSLLFLITAYNVLK